MESVAPKTVLPSSQHPRPALFLIPPCLNAFVVGFAAEEESESVVHFLKDFVFPADCDPLGSLLPSWLPVFGSLLTRLQRLTWRSSFLNRLRNWPCLATEKMGTWYHKTPWRSATPSSMTTSTSDTTGVLLSLRD